MGVNVMNINKKLDDIHEDYVKKTSEMPISKNDDIAKSFGAGYIFDDGLTGSLFAGGYIASEIGASLNDSTN